MTTTLAPETEVQKPMDAIRALLASSGEDLAYAASTFFYAQAQEAQKTHDSSRYDFTFSKPVSLNGKKPAKKHSAIRFFIGHKTEALCFMTKTQHRRGSYATYFPFASIVDVQVWVPKKLNEVEYSEKLLRGFRNVAKHVHPNAWPDLQPQGEAKYRDELATSPRYQSDMYYKPRYKLIKELFMRTRKFSRSKSFDRFGYEELVKQLTKAFEDKAEFSWTRLSNSTSMNIGRDLRISARQDADGVYRAWLSSEYPGCGNGDYYLLISPTRAVYNEKD
jgi:hypothetical protein